MTDLWYLAYSLDYREIEKLVLECKLKIAHFVINRWVIDYFPQLEESFRNRSKHPVGIYWWRDEIFIILELHYTYLYRAIDKKGQPVDFMLSEKSDEPAVCAFFNKTIESSGIPDKVIMNKSGANKARIDTIKMRLMLMFILVDMRTPIIIRQIKYLNNIIKQDRRSIKKITIPMKRFKTFHSSQATITGIEMHQIIHKGKHSQSGSQTIFEQFYGHAA
jgi:putative transposase